MEKTKDFKKTDKNLYLPLDKPTFIEIPEMNFIMVDGKGNPNNNATYQEAIEIIYALSYTIKMSKMSSYKIAGYFEYVVPPLEGLWWVDGNSFDLNKRENWLWTMMLRQPDFVTEDVFNWALGEVRKKKPHLDIARAKLKKFQEGSVVQMLHVGPYGEDEKKTVAKMQEFMEEKRLKDDTGNIRKHHEIYLSDFRKVDAEKLKTIIRHPVSRKE